MSATRRTGLRVGLVCPYSFSRPGGVQSHVAGLARALRSAGLAVDVLAPADGPVAEDGFVPLGRSTAVHDNGSVQRVALSPAAIARVTRVARSGHYDLLHLHEPLIPFACFAALVTARVPLVGTFHMYAPGPRWYRVFGPICRRALAQLDARVAVSGPARDFVVGSCCPSACEVIPNGVELPAEAARGSGLSAGRILFVGRREPRKGLPVLLEAFRRLPGEPELELVGVTADELARLGAQLGEPARRVCARGRVSDAERARRIAEADILCVPSLGAESFGLVLAEGMAAGVAVVASAIPGYVDVLRPGCGRLVPPGDSTALAGALAELLDDPGERGRLGAAARNEAERYSWPRVAERILAVYERVLEEPRRSPAAARAVVAV